MGGLLLLVALAWALRVVPLDLVGLEHDEVVSIAIGTRPVTDLLRDLATVEPHPPFHYLLLGWLHLVAGGTEFATRFPAAFFGLLIVPLTYQAGRLLLGYRLGVLAALLIGLNAYQILQTQQVRMYPPAIAFGLFGAVAALQGVRSGQRRWFAAAVAGLWLAAFSHYYALFHAVAVGGAVAVWLARRKDRRGLGWWLGALAVGAVLYLPWLIFSWSLVSRHRAVPLGFAAYLETLLTAGRYFTFALTPYPDAVFWAAIPGFLLALTGLVWWLLRSPGPYGRFGGVFLGAYLLAPLAGGLAIAFTRNAFEPRYLLIAGPALALATAAGLLGTLRRFAPGGVLVALGILIITVVPTIDLYQWGLALKSDYRVAARALLADHRPGEAVILASDWQSLQYWYYVTFRAGSDLPVYVFPHGEPPDRERLAEIMERHTGAWLMDYAVESGDPERRTERYLRREHRLIIPRRDEARLLSLFAPASLTGNVAAFQPLDITVSGPDGAPRLRLTGGRGSGPALTPGATAVADLRGEWLITNVPAPGISRRLLDAGGRVVWQRDGVLPAPDETSGPTFDDLAGFVVPDYLPPGDYRLVAVLYDAATGEPLPLTPPLERREIPLGAVQIAEGKAENRWAAAPVDPIAVARQSGLRLEGLRLPPESILPGGSFDLPILWSADGESPAEARLEVTLPGGRRIAGAPVGGPDYPPAHWTPGRRVLQWVPVDVPADLTTGRYPVRLQVVGTRGSLVQVEAGALVVRERERVAALPTNLIPQDAEFGGRLRLAGSSSRDGQTARPGDPLHIDLAWRVLSTPDRDYTRFVHLVGPDGRLSAQDDRLLGGTERPPATWRPDEFFVETATLNLPPDAPAGTYQIISGVYDPTTLRRLPHSGGDDYAILGTVTVIK